MWSNAFRAPNRILFCSIFLLLMMSIAPVAASPEKLSSDWSDWVQLYDPHENYQMRFRCDGFEAGSYAHVTGVQVGGTGSLPMVIGGYGGSGKEAEFSIEARYGDRAHDYKAQFGLGSKFQAFIPSGPDFTIAYHIRSQNIVIAGPATLVTKSAEWYQAGYDGAAWIGFSVDDNAAVGSTITITIAMEVVVVINAKDTAVLPTTPSLQSSFTVERSPIGGSQFAEGWIVASIEAVLALVVLLVVIVIARRASGRRSLPATACCRYCGAKMEGDGKYCTNCGRIRS